MNVWFSVVLLKYTYYYSYMYFSYGHRPPILDAALKGSIPPSILEALKVALYRIRCGVNRLGDSGVNRLGDTSAFVNPAGQLLLTRQDKTRMDGVGIVFEFYLAPL